MVFEQRHFLYNSCVKIIFEIVELICLCHSKNFFNFFTSLRGITLKILDNFFFLESTELLSLNKFGLNLSSIHQTIRRWKLCRKLAKNTVFVKQKSDDFFFIIILCSQGCMFRVNIYTLFTISVSSRNIKTSAKILLINRFYVIN